jgi:segregation and condensation protein B
VQPALDDELVLSAMESLLLIAAGPVSADRLAAATGEPLDRVRSLLASIPERLPTGIRLQRQGDQAQLVTAPENIEVVHAFLGTSRPNPLSRAALETLTVIAYRQPITRSEIEAARGVNSDRALQTLLARELIQECGHRQTVGRPMEYGTSFGFLEYFGLQSLDDLPPLPVRSDDNQPNAGDLGFRRETEE